MKKSIVFALLLFFSSNLFALNIAIMAADYAYYANDVKNKLITTGMFGQVDLYQINLVTPTLAEMQNYDAILVYSNAPIANASVFGDTLADYVDGGGGVVTALFATSSTHITGRFNQDDYWAIEPSSNAHLTRGFLGTIFEPAHPIMAGVNSFDGGSQSYRPAIGDLHPNATRIANWSLGSAPLIATRVIHGVRRVDLGFFPPSSDALNVFWESDTDGDIILANSLKWVANGSTAVPLSNSNKALLALLFAFASFFMMQHRRVA